MRSPNRLGSESCPWTRQEASLLLSRPHPELGTVCLPLLPVTSAECVQSYTASTPYTHRPAALKPFARTLRSPASRPGLTE